VTPGRYVERVRVAEARRLLETTALTTDLVARRCGLGTAESLRRAFVRNLGVSPGAYRSRFATREPSPT
jgi:transcriptional regulator GlxA family with amidase domain